MATFPKLKLPKLKSPSSTQVSDRWPAEVAQQQRRITGVTPRVVRSYQEAPAKFIPRSRGLLKSLGGGKSGGSKEKVSV